MVQKRAENISREGEVGDLLGEDAVRRSFNTQSPAFGVIPVPMAIASSSSAAACNDGLNKFTAMKRTIKQNVVETYKNL
jgi:hypothetical protein